jgi:hypothetical protein
MGEVTVAWERDIIERVQLVAGLLKESGRDRAIDQLDVWCSQIVGSLGLRRLPVAARTVPDT